MKRKSEVGKQIEMFDKYNRALTYTDGGGTVGKYRPVVDFLSELREQRALTQTLLTKIMGYGNLKASTRRVKKNKGIGGVDGRQIEETINWLGDNYEELRQSVLKGTYEVSEVLGVEITKESGGVRELGIPTVLDRIVQQAIHQQLNPLYDRHFSESSYGFRPNRNAHMAVRQASRNVEEGLVWVVDIDLEKYFDTIPHDRLMQRLSKGIGDKQLLRLIHQYLKAGLMKEGLSEQRTKGSPQGGPLSPLLSNIVLDELDKELEKRGHHFCRYADDCNIFVGSRKAGERVMGSVIDFLEKKLKLRVNRKKSGVRHCSKVKFLGYTIESNGRIRVSDESIKRLKRKVIKITKRNRGVKFSQVIGELNKLILGWGAYYSLANTYLSTIRELDGQIRRRLRCYRLKQCGRVYSVVKFLRSLGIPEQKCWNAACYRDWWRMTIYPSIAKAMGLRWFADQGLSSLQVVMKRYNN
jgi:group II intron reverse transcriptase/maturase